MNLEEALGSLAAATGWPPSELLELDLDAIEFWARALNKVARK